MNDLRDLYQDVILDHYRRPRHRGALVDANRRAQGFNPLCGDQLTLYVRVKDGVIEEVSFEGSGCAISTASASLPTESIKGKTEREAPAAREADAEPAGRPASGRGRAKTAAPTGGRGSGDEAADERPARRRKSA